MTDERKAELGVLLKAMAIELQNIADELREDMGNRHIGIEISGNSSDLSHLGLDASCYITAHLHEEDVDGERRMVAITEYKDREADADNKISKLLFYDRNDIVRKDEEDGESESNTEE